MALYKLHAPDKKTEVFKKDYHQHRSGVEGSLSALVLGHGFCVSRYIGQKKRTTGWLSGERPQVRQ
jgi:hypothetical protein